MDLDLIVSCRSTVTEWELNNILLITSRVNRRNGHKNSLSKCSPGITAEDTQESISSVPHVRTYMTNLLAFRARKKRISPENISFHHRMKTALFTLTWGELVARYWFLRGTDDWGPSAQHLHQWRLLHRGPDSFRLSLCPTDCTVSTEIASNTFWKYSWNYNTFKK